MLVSFTGSKTISNVNGWGFSDFNSGSMNTADLALEKSIDPFSASRNLVTSWLYEIPVGKGKHFASAAHGVVNQVVGGWEVGSVQTYRNGYPLSVSGGVPLPIFDTETRPNELSGVPIRGQNCSNIQLGQSVIANINAFTSNGPLQFGDAPRVLPAFRGCAWLDEDFSVQKRFFIREGMKLEFRSEFYNIFNRHKYADPGLNINNPGTFAQVVSTDGSYQPRLIQFAIKLNF